MVINYCFLVPYRYIISCMGNYVNGIEPVFHPSSSWFGIQHSERGGLFQDVVVSLLEVTFTEL